MSTLVRVDCIAALFGTSAKQVHRWKSAHSGFPPAVDTEPVTGALLYDRKQVIAWGVLTRRWDPIADKPTDDYKRCPCCDKVIIQREDAR